MTGIRDWKKNNATAYFLQHPEASISDCAKAVGVSHRTAAQARTELAAKGLMTPGRGRTPSQLPADSPVPPAPSEVKTSEAPSPADGDRLLDDKTMRALAGSDILSDPDLDLDDEATRTKLLREVKRIAFSPTSHPDTRLSATQVWLKLKDMAKSRELGPGKPLTREAAISRLIDLLRMVGPDIAIAATYRAFNVQEPTDAGELPADTSEATPSAAPTTGAPGGEAEVHEHGESAGPQPLG